VTTISLYRERTEESPWSVAGAQRTFDDPCGIARALGLLWVSAGPVDSCGSCLPRAEAGTTARSAAPSRIKSERASHIPLLIALGLPHLVTPNNLEPASDGSSY